MKSGQEAAGSCCRCLTCLQLCLSSSAADERVQRAQEAVISFGITVSLNTYGPETGGRATVRHGGFGLLIVRAPGKGKLATLQFVAELL